MPNDFKIPQLIALSPEDSYFRARMAEIGVTDEINTYHYRSNDANRIAQYFTPSEDGGIKINYRGLNGMPLFDPSDTRVNKQSFFRTRLHPRKAMLGKKYDQRAKSGIQVYAPPLIIEACLNASSIDTLVLVEGEFKAWVGAQSGIPTIGLSGIWGYRLSGDKDLHPTIVEVIKTCRVKNLVLLFDGDCLDVDLRKWRILKDEPPENQLDLNKRVGGFFNSVRAFREAAKLHVQDVYFTAIEPALETELGHKCKGLDDLIIARKTALPKPHQGMMLEGNDFNEAKALEEYEYPVGEMAVEHIRESVLQLTAAKHYFDSYNITEAKEFKKVERYFRQTKEKPHYAPTQFYEVFKDEIASEPFLWDGKIYKFDDEERVLKAEHSDDRIKFLPSDATEEETKSFEEYGFYFRNNRMWALAPAGKERQVSQSVANFQIRCLYLVTNSKKAKRIVEMVNHKNRKVVIDVETTQLTTMSKFLDFTTSQGDFFFEGNPTQHRRLQAKMYDEELPGSQIEELGWLPDGFWAWSNGIVRDGRFYPTNKHGIVELSSAEDENDRRCYYIPAGNQEYANNPTKYASAKRFTYKSSEVTFSQYAKALHDVFGDAAKIALAFAVATVFADIFTKKRPFFPLIFLFSHKGGSGKGTLIRSCQHLFGDPQDSLMLSGRANTDKAKIRVMAQLANAIILLDEFKTDQKDSTDLLKQLWDRQGYKRGNLDSNYSTEDVPIQSTIMVTGNEYPNDDPLLTRLLVVEMSKTEFSEHDKARYNALKDLEAIGLTSVTMELLNHRRTLERRYYEEYQKLSKQYGKEWSGLGLSERMIDNAACISAPMLILSEFLNWPFSAEDLKTALRESLTVQNEKRATESATNRFWDIMIFFASRGVIKEGKEILVDGDYLLLRFQELHTLYSVECKKMGVAPMSKSTLREQLKQSPEFLKTVSNQRFKDAMNTSCLCFDYNKLQTYANFIKAFNSYSSEYSGGQPMNITESTSKPFAGNPPSKAAPQLPMEEEVAPF